MPTLAISTHWIAYRHDNGEALVDEMLAAGFQAVELGYDTRHELVPGLCAAISAGRIACNSVHNTCPLPEGITHGHPELFLLASTDPNEQQAAIYHTRSTIAFAASIGARTIVSHAGNVAMRPYTPKLTKLALQGKRDTRRYDRLRAKAHAARAQYAPAHFDALCRAIERLLPDLEKHQVVLAFENLPSLEAIPTLEEQQALFTRFSSPHLQYWHDFGHGQVLQQLGIAPHLARLRRFRDRTAGVHIHDTNGISDMHGMPPLPQGIAWEAALSLVQPEWTLVLEPAPGTSTEAVQQACCFLSAHIAAHAPTSAHA